MAAASSSRADRLRLDQAIGTLVDNALRYGAGTIDALAPAAPARRSRSTSPTRATASRPTSSTRAFERFSRAPGVRDGGSGLGLAIVATVAEAHGGSGPRRQPARRRRRRLGLHPALIWH